MARMKTLQYLKTLNIGDALMARDISTGKDSGSVGLVLKFLTAEGYVEKIGQEEQGTYKSAIYRKIKEIPEEEFRRAELWEEQKEKKRQGRANMTVIVGEKHDTGFRYSCIACRVKIIKDQYYNFHRLCENCDEKVDADKLLREYINNPLKRMNWVEMLSKYKPEQLNLLGKVLNVWDKTENDLLKTTLSLSSDPKALAVWRGLMVELFPEYADLAGGAAGAPAKIPAEHPVNDVKTTNDVKICSVCGKRHSGTYEFCSLKCRKKARAAENPQENPRRSEYEKEERTA